MKLLVFISGLLVGSLATGFVMTAPLPLGGNDAPVVGEDQIRNELPALQGESDILRLIALEHLRGMPLAEATAMLSGLGLLSDLRDEGSLLMASLPERSGQITLQIDEGAVSDVLNYCWNTGGDCTLSEVSD